MRMVRARASLRESRAGTARQMEQGGAQARDDGRKRDDDEQTRNWFPCARHPVYRLPTIRVSIRIPIGRRIVRSVLGVHAPDGAAVRVVRLSRSLAVAPRRAAPGGVGQICRWNGAGAGTGFPRVDRGRAVPADQPRGTLRSQLTSFCWTIELAQGRAGFEVLTPLQRPNGRIVLIDRGWVPFSGVRARLPGVDLKSRDNVTVTGRVANLPAPGLASGRAPPAAQLPWPKVTSFPTISQLSVALGSALEPRIVLLDPAADDGYVRDWHPPGHRADAELVLRGAVVVFRARVACLVGQT